MVSRREATHRRGGRQPKVKASPAHRRYRCSDGWLALACSDEAQWKALAKGLGRPELAYPGSWSVARTAAPRGRLGRLLERLFAPDPVETWLLRLQPQGVPCRRAGS